MEGNKCAQRMEIWCRAFPAPALNRISPCTCAFSFLHHSPINQQPLRPGDGMGAAFWHLAAAPGLQASHSGVCPSCSSWPDRHPALSHQAGPAHELVSELTPSTKPEELGTPTAPLDPHSSPPSSPSRLLCINKTPGRVSELQLPPCPHQHPLPRVPPPARRHFPARSDIQQLFFPLRSAKQTNKQSQALATRGKLVAGESRL